MSTELLYIFNRLLILIFVSSLFHQKTFLRENKNMVPYYMW